MSGERVQKQTLVDDLTLEQFKAIPRAKDQELVTSLGYSCLSAWQQDPEVSSQFDLSIAEDILQDDKIACLEWPDIRELFSPHNYDPEGAVHVGGVDYILIPQYPEAYLKGLKDRAEELVESERERYHYSGTWFTYSADRAMGKTNRIIILDMTYITKSFKERDFSSALGGLQRVLSNRHKRSYYLTAIAEELSHALVDPFTQGVEEEYPGYASRFYTTLSEGMANGLALRALTLEEIECFYLVSDHLFLPLSSLFFQEIIDNGLLDEMRNEEWYDELHLRLRGLIRRIYGRTPFDPNDTYAFNYPPRGYKPADWLKGLKKE
jgi:hypothetical protein